MTKQYTQEQLSRLGAAYTKEEMHRAQREYEKAYQELQEEVADVRASVVAANPDVPNMPSVLEDLFKTDRKIIRAFNQRVGNPFARAVNRARIITQAAMMLTEVPRKYAKALEMATRLVLSVSRIPNNTWTWIQRNQKHLDFILHQIPTFTPKKDGVETEATFTVGPLTVHNAVGVSGKELDNVRKLLDQSVRAIKKSNVPGFQKVLYGDVVLVGQTVGARTLAYYKPDKDVIYIRPTSKYSHNVLHVTVHEFGHRYWQKFMDTGAVDQWVQRHDQMSGAPLRMPSVGDHIPLLFHGQVDYSKVVAIRDNYYFMDQGPPLGANELKRLLVKHQVGGGFPTIYSKTNAEEHFCEVVGLEATGKLNKVHQEALYGIFEKRRAANLAQKVAARFLKHRGL